MENVVVGYLQMPNGDYLRSQGFHDCKQRIDPDKDVIYMIDDFGRRSGGLPAVCLTLSSPHEEVREHAQWFTNRAGVITGIFVKDLEDDHIVSILSEGHGRGSILVVLCNELVYRGNTEEYAAELLAEGDVIRAHLEQEFKDYLLRKTFAMMEKDRS